MNMMRVERMLAAAIVVLALVPGRADAADCEFVLGFKALADLIPDRVGNCLDNESHNPANGDALQHTTAWHGQGGLLVWRKADNWTAFTDGATTWINGPGGLVSRPNGGPLFPWEVATPGAAPAAAPAAPSAPSPAPPAPAPAWPRPAPAAPPPPWPPPANPPRFTPPTNPPRFAPGTAAAPETGDGVRLVAVQGAAPGQTASISAEVPPGALCVLSYTTPSDVGNPSP